MITHFIGSLETCREYAFLGGSAWIIMILITLGGSNFNTIMHSGGIPNLLQYQRGRGVSWDLKFLLRNIWTALYHSLLYSVSYFDLFFCISYPINKKYQIQEEMSGEIGLWVVVIVILTCVLSEGNLLGDHIFNLAITST